MAMESHEPSQRSSRPTLNSNVLNYLVWRYLQEVGFAMAATWLGKEWHRCPDDVMPFAKHVKPSQLVHMIQDALFVDQIRQQGGKPAQYFFGDDFGPDYAAPVYDISGERKPGDIPPRPSEPLAPNGLSEHASQPRLKKKQPLQQKRINGDAMDIDENGYRHSDQPSDAETPSSAVHEVSTLVDTLNIGENKMVATEKPIDLLPSSTFLPWPAQKCTSTPLWSPFEQGPLLIGGSDNLRLYGIKPEPQEEPRSFDVEIPASQFEIGLMCWTSSTTAAVSVFETLEGEDADDEVGKLIHITRYGRGDPQILSSMTGIVRALRFNTSTGLLLSLSTGISTTISIHKIDGAIVTPLCVKDLHSVALSDAFWMSDTRFIACGKNILQIFEIRDQEIHIIQTQEFKRPWFQLKYDAISDIAVFVNEEATILRQYHVGTEDTKTQPFEGTRINAFEFQPIPDPKSWEPDSQRLLATCTLDGLVQLWDISQGFTCVNRLQVYGFPGRTLRQIAFSPDGRWLAGAGFDTVAMWNPDEEGQLKAIWRADVDQWRSVPDESAGEEDWIHELKWDMASEKVVFTLEDQAVVIRVPEK